MLIVANGPQNPTFSDLRASMPVIHRGEEQIRAVANLPRLSAYSFRHTVTTSFAVLNARMELPRTI
jgi:hypothetical protein